MKIAVVTLFPELVESFAAHGIPRIALDIGALTLIAINPRDFTDDTHRTVDGRPYGGGPGMVMLAQPLQQAIRAAKEQLVASAPPQKVVTEKVVTVYLSPQGRQYTQALAREIVQGKLTGPDSAADNTGQVADSADSGAAEEVSLVLVAGRYEGVDERLLEQEIDFEWSVGDFVLSGGELAALAVVDTLARLLPGVLGNAESALNDSFGTDGLLDCPHYTRPPEFQGVRVPDVLMSGDHAAIARWRREQSTLRTAARRPDLLRRSLAEGALSKDDLQLLRDAGFEFETPGN